MRLDKFLIESCLGTRSVVRDYIKQGLIKVNGATIKRPELYIDEKNDIVEYLEKKIEHKGKVYYMLNKSAGYITARSDLTHKTVFDFFHDINMDGVFHVGRLDKDTEGMLLFTNDGEFERKLMHPENHIKKTYFFWALGSLDSEKIKNIEDGIYINNGEFLTKPAKIEITNSGYYKDFKNIISIQDLDSIDYSKYNQPMVSGYLTISEGKKHQVKRMLKAVGCYVVYLNRISIGDLKMDKSLEKGEYRELTKCEIEKLLKKDHKIN